MLRDVQILGPHEQRRRHLKRVRGDQHVRSRAQQRLVIQREDRPSVVGDLAVRCRLAKPLRVLFQHHRDGGGGHNPVDPNDVQPTVDPAAH